MSIKSDVIIDPFRPGVMEKLGLGPDILMKNNKKLIYARLTGYGQSGPMSQKAGHDINYIAMSGILSMLGRKNDKPTPPINLIADFAGGGLLCAFGICIALLERHRTGEGQIIDHSMVEGTAYVASWLTRSQSLDFIWPEGKRGENLLDTGTHFYDTYETKDGKYMAVGAIEPVFYQTLVDKLELPNIFQFENYDENKVIFTKKFKEKTQKEWCDIFDKTDACVTPVLNWNESHMHQHNQIRKSFIDKGIPNPAPKFNKMNIESAFKKPEKTPIEYAKEILDEIGYSKDDLKSLYESGVLLLENKPKL